MDKSQGEAKVKHNLSNNKTNHNSRSWHYKADKCRGWRRRADRHTHHRRRKIQKEAIKMGIEDYVIPPSSGGLRGCGWKHAVAQSKKVIGARDQFYLESPVKKPAKPGRKFR